MNTPAGSAETNLPQTGPSAFDEHRPPPRELLDDCVHCGFCLPTCPTYQLWGEEMDSPRGRIYLMNLAEKGEIGLEGPFQQHIDRCLGCMACVTACPSGVQYDRLLESVRPQLERNVPRRPDDRLFREAIFALFPYKRRLRVAALPGALYQKLRRVPAIATLARKLPGRLGALESLLPPVSLREAFARLPVYTPAVGARRG
jgi:glycolate oxidase iron-sulfur subunit